MNNLTEGLKMNAIWFNGETHDDFYVDFHRDFIAEKAPAKLFIACDSIYAVFVNGVVAGFGQCSDYPHYKYYDEIDISECLKDKNSIDVTVWYTGYGEALNYTRGKPMLAYLIKQGENVVAQSDENTMSRINVNYKNGRKKLITTQLGYGFYYDNTKHNGEFFKSEVKFPVTAHKRQIDGLMLRDRAKVQSIIEKPDGYIIDLGEETVGFIDLNFMSPTEQELLIAYNEYLEDGEVRHIVDYRDYSVGFYAKKGVNEYLNRFRRIACRYLRVYCKEKIEIKYIGVRSVERKVKTVNNKFKNRTVDKIYNVAVNTLKKCMHEHYEDCPLREQALYNMDSRNQMLCGYYAFEGTSFQRYNLELMARSKLNKHGLLDLSFPSGFDKSIPFFTLIYVLQTQEYIKYSGDRSILDINGEKLKNIINGFSSRIDETNLIACFETPCWNFYEWTAGSDGETRDDLENDEKIYDLILNCIYVYVCRSYDKIFGVYTDTAKIERAIYKTFYDKERGLFKSSTHAPVVYTQLGNALASLIGLGNEEILNKIIADERVIKASLSMRAFLYDALLKFGNEYKDYIVDDIIKINKPMIDAGSSTLWETEYGYKDFDGAGSMCHGWSAIPVYYFNILPQNGYRNSVLDKIQK